MFCQGFCFHYGFHYQATTKDVNFWVDNKMPTSLGKNQVVLHGCTNLIWFHWDLEFHVHIDASNLVVGIMLAQNFIKKYDQSIAYASQLFNNIEENYTMTEKETLTMVYAFHKIYHYLLGNKFIFYVDHLVLLYLVWKSQVSRKIIRWLLFFLEYDFSKFY
jgi:hypothetical protein